MSNLNRHPVRRAAVGVLAGTLAFTGGAIAAGATPANAVQGFAFERLAGADRYATAAAIARDGFATADDVVLASGAQRNFPDALTGNYLAGAVQGPILLTAPGSLPQSTEDALESLGTETVHIVGGTSAVSAAVEAELERLGYTVNRLGGIDRYATAELVAMEVGDNSTSTTVGETDGARTAILGNGQNFPDILAAGPLSYAEQFPITITRPNDLPANTEDVLRDLGIERVIIVGGPTAVSTAVENEVDAFVDQVDRIGGQTRFNTAVNLAEFAYDELGFDETHVNLARGDDFADALAGGPHGGEDRAPIVLTFPTSLQPATAAFLRAHCPTLEDGHIFGGPVAVSPAVEAQAEEEASTCTAQGGNATVTGTDTTVAPGEAVTGTITGENIDSVSVTGCGVTAQAVNDTNATTDGIQFSVTIPNNQTADCTLTFTTTFEDGTTETDTLAVDVQAPAGSATATTRPELVSASLVGTTTNAGPNNISGDADDFEETRVRYVFDESLQGSLNAPTATNFFLVGDDPDVRYAGRTASIDSSNPNAVIVTFGRPVSGLTPEENVGSAQLAGVTVATVDPGAVTDNQGQQNPYGDAPYGTGSTGTVGAAGITAAPDLQNVQNFREDTGTATAGDTLVDFTFDEPAFTKNTSGFHLVLTDGQTDITCTAVPGAAGGQSATTGTQTITVTCPSTVVLTAANVARGYVVPGTVGDAAGAGNVNVLQASETPDTASSTADLDSIQLRPASSTSGADAVLFDFDEAVLVANEAAPGTQQVPGQPGVQNNNFCVYTSAQSVVCSDTAARSTVDASQVLATFAAGTVVDNAVGGIVLEGAVVEQDNARPNQEDEEGVNNTQSTTTTPGRTVGPDLTGVRVDVVTRDPFTNEPTEFRVVYTFDEEISAFGANSQFVMLLANGTQFDCATPVRGTSATTGTNTVICDDFTGTGYTEAQEGQIAAGAVNNDVVRDADGNQNPEGYEVATGTRS